LLDSVASQAGIALENIRLAEKMAARLEADLRAAHELEIAREVQARLLPQKMPPLETLEYAGGCIQAREVGGDYYDFLDLGPGRVGLVLADISGKGISGAMLMANLQANLRSQYAVALEDLPGLLRSVNRLFHENTPDDSYATLFFADYNDADRRLRYANCGHNFPLLLRAGGGLERLAATATVLGMFSDWTCSVEEIVLQPRDLLVMYTDGISEAPDHSGEEFGEARLIETIRRSCHLSPTALIEKIQATVQEFSHGGQADDLTMVIGRSVSARSERGAS
jgi:serine phosphatase RsbU (regulator of sigma subunit)